MNRVILFTGHRIDAPDRPNPRFPATRAPHAARAIAAAIPDDAQIGLCSAANGGDILFLEVCAARAIPWHIILPFPREEFLRRSVATDAPGDWETRFRRLWSDTPADHRHILTVPEGTRIVTTSSDGIARAWDAATGVQVLRREGHEGLVNSAAYSRDGTRIVTASDDSTARVWDINVPPSNILQIACQWLPFVNGSRDYFCKGRAADIGILTLRPIGPCETYNPPLPRPSGGP